MTDSPPDPPSDDPFGSFADEAEMLDFMRETLRRLRRGGGAAGASGAGSGSEARDAAGGAEQGPAWWVEERDDGTFAVVSETTGTTAASLHDRRRAYLLAATLTAAGSQPQGPADALAEPAADPPAGWGDDPVERRKELTARTLRGLLANPKAIELFLQSIEPDVLREAMEIREGDGEDDDSSGQPN